jgi:hypothetical protein
MKSKRSTIRQCRQLAKEHVDDPNEPAAPTGDSGFGEWVQITIILLYTELNKSFRETEAWFNDSKPLHEELNLPKTPDHTTLCRWEQQVSMRELRSLLRTLRSRLAGQVQQQSMRVGFSVIKQATTIETELDFRSTRSKQQHWQIRTR